MDPSTLVWTDKGGIDRDGTLDAAEVDEILKRLQQLNTKNEVMYKKNLLEYKRNLENAFEQLHSGTKYVLELKDNHWIEEDSILRKRLEALQSCFRELSTVTAESFREISDKVVDACHLEETMSARSHASGDHVKLLETHLSLAENAEINNRKSCCEAEEEYLHVRTISNQLERKVKHWGWWERRMPGVPQRRRMLEISQKAEKDREQAFQTTKIKHHIAIEGIRLGKYALDSQRSGEELLKDILESVKVAENTLIETKENFGSIYRHVSMFEVFIASDLMLLSRTFFLRCVLQLLWSEYIAEVFAISTHAKSANDDILSMCQAVLSEEEWEQIVCPPENFIEHI